MSKYRNKLDLIFFALSNTRRRDILNLLLKNDNTVTELSHLMSITIASISKHLQLLLSAGLVSHQRKGNKIIYSLEINELLPVMIWLESFGSLNILDLDGLEKFFSDQAIL